VKRRFLPGLKAGVYTPRSLATCTDVDLRGASLSIADGFDALRGTTIDSVQLVTLAPQLANHLGITVVG
jgi:hypothetical protein